MCKLKFTKKDIIYLAIILLLIAGLAVMTVLYAAEAKRKQSEQSYYEIKCASFAVQNANLSQGQIVFLGDSITDLYHLDDYYADLPLACYNRGIGGDTTDGVLARLQTSAIDLHPSKIVLMIGTNDVGGRRNNDAILENYRNILQTLHTALPDCEIYCVSVIPQNQLLGTFAIESNERIRVLNPGIKALAEEYGAAYLDLFPLLEDEDGMLIASCSDDGIHLNAAGFRIWTDLLKPYLE